MQTPSFVLSVFRGLCRHCARAAASLRAPSPHRPLTPLAPPPPPPPSSPRPLQHFRKEFQGGRFDDDVFAGDLQNFIDEDDGKPLTLTIMMKYRESLDYSSKRTQLQHCPGVGRRACTRFVPGRGSAVGLRAAKRRGVAPNTRPARRRACVRATHTRLTARDPRTGC